LNAGTVTTDITAVVSSGNAILDAIEGADPALDVPAETAGLVLNTLAELVTAALTAFSNASGTPITVESVQALLPNPTPLPEPS
jgi:hypothetical protein